MIGNKLNFNYITSEVGNLDEIKAFRLLDKGYDMKKIKKMIKVMCRFVGYVWSRMLDVNQVNFWAEKADFNK